MTIGLVGRKSGMTRIFAEDGASVPVTVIEVEPNRITQVKNVETDGYNAVQVTVGSRRASRVSSSSAGHFAKANTEAGRGIWELRNDQKVDVTGTSKGKGFAGGVKRWNFAMQDATHGNSISHRAPGSIGQCQTPGRVFKGKKMAGHMGAELIKGAVPGAPGGDVIVRPAIKVKKA